jgi:hypothetical protein
MAEIGRYWKILGDVGRKCQIAAASARFLGNLDRF